MQEKQENIQKNNPLHGVTLQAILELLCKRYSWEELADRVNINCFIKNPSIKSSLNFLRKTEWARLEVEELYLSEMENDEYLKNNPDHK